MEKRRRKKLNREKASVKQIVISTLPAGNRQQKRLLDLFNLQEIESERDCNFFNNWETKSKKTQKKISSRKIRVSNNSGNNCLTIMKLRFYKRKNLTSTTYKDQKGLHTQ